MLSPCIIISPEKTVKYVMISASSVIAKKSPKLDGLIQSSSGTNSRRSEQQEARIRLYDHASPLKTRITPTSGNQVKIHEGCE